VSMLDTNCDPILIFPSQRTTMRSGQLLIVGRLADAIYEGRHGQLDMEEDYEDYEGAEDLDYEERIY